MASRRILSLNCGSSSLKFGVFELSEGQPQLLFEGEAEEIGSDGSTFWTKSPQDNARREDKAPLNDHDSAFQRAMRALRDADLQQVDAAGHRVVHGGPKVRAHVKLDDRTLQELKDAVQFAPLHLPSSFAVIEAMRKAKPDLPQAICLDTAFHCNMPDVAKTLPLPQEVRRMGVERYGFHGLSLESIVAQFDHVPARLVVAHLGNGSSVTAIHNGESIDTSMGLTPTGGVMMGSRSGDLDPGVLIFLMRHGYKTADRIEELVDRQSGMKGISGGVSDVRTLTKTRTTNEGADLALRMFAYQVRKTIAGMIGALGGLDTLVFTGGIGENDAGLRDEITQHLRFCGSFEVRAMASQEDLQIARIAARILEIQ